MDACSSEKTSCTHLVYTKCILPDNFTYLSIPIEWGLPLLSTLLFFKQSRTQQYVQKVDTAKACGKPYSYSPRLLSIQLNSTLLQQSQKLLTRVHPFSAHLLHLAMKCNSRHAWQSLQLRENSSPVVHTSTCHKVPVTRLLQSQLWLHLALQKMISTPAYPHNAKGRVKIDCLTGWPCWTDAGIKNGSAEQAFHLLHILETAPHHWFH
jgi:hypothetical protein